MQDKEVINIIILIIGVMIFLVMLLLIIMKRSKEKVTKEQLQRQELVIQHRKESLLHSIQAQEKERNRVSEELHDGIVSKLNIINLKLSSIESSTVLRNIDQIDLIKVLLNTAIEDTRRISYDLMPVVLDSFGLITAIREMSESSNVHIEFKTNVTDETIGGEKSTHIYRIVQELVNNSIKHSQCTRIDILLYQQDDGILLNVRDDGIGNVADLNNNLGLGLKNIKNRLLFLNGKMNVSDKNPGLNFKISLLNKET